MRAFRGPRMFEVQERHCGDRHMSTYMNGLVDEAERRAVPPVPSYRNATTRDAVDA